MLLLVLYSDLWLYEFYFWPRHVYDFIMYFILDIPHMYSKLAILLSRKSDISSHKPDSDIHCLDKICQDIT